MADTPDTKTPNPAAADTTAPGAPASGLRSGVSPFPADLMQYALNRIASDPRIALQHRDYSRARFSLGFNQEAYFNGFALLGYMLAAEDFYSGRVSFKMEPKA